MPALLPILLKALAFANSPLGRKLGLALGVLLLLAAIWLAGDRHGRHVAEARQARAQAAAEASAEKVTRSTTAAAAEIRTTAEKAVTASQVRTQILTKEVPVYVPAEADRNCVVNTGFVRLLDDAAGGLASLPARAGGPVTADSGVALSTVAETDVANAGAFRELEAEVKAWRTWYPAMAGEWEKNRPPDR